MGTRSTYQAGCEGHQAADRQKDGQKRGRDQEHQQGAQLQYGQLQQDQQLHKRQRHGAGQQAGGQPPLGQPLLTLASLKLGELARTATALAAKWQRKCEKVGTGGERAMHGRRGVAAYHHYHPMAQHHFGCLVVHHAAVTSMPAVVSESPFCMLVPSCKPRRRPRWQPSGSSW